MPNLAFTVGNLTGPIHLLSGQDEITLSGSVVIGFDPALIDNEKAIVILPEARQVSACLRLGALLEIFFSGTAPADLLLWRLQTSTVRAIYAARAPW
jgi:hypothetical protein